MRSPLLSAVALACLLTGCSDKPSYERWALPGFMFNDWAKIISITGTLKGEGVGYPMNTWEISCSQDEMKCRVAEAMEIGNRQLGRIDVSDWTITAWNETTVTADEGDPTSCAHNLLVINRVAKTVAYTSSPQNQDKDYCKGYNKFVGQKTAGTYNWEIGKPKQPWE